MILLDTNILVYALNADSPQHEDCRRIVELAVTGALPAVLLPQVVVECYAVVTSPRRVPRSLTPRQAWAALRMLMRAVDVRPPSATMLEDLDLLMTQHPRRGRDVFDLAIVAQMLDHGIRAICTCNVADFGIAGIRAIEPTEALAVYA